MEITLGPLLFFWPRNDVLAFYERVGDSAVDRVYLGEVVCNKRRELTLGGWLDIARQLQEKGKTVVLSTLALIESQSELASVRKICEQEGIMVEASDMAAVQYLSSHKVPFTAGPGMNLYNSRALKVLYELGMRRWIMPVELSCDHLHSILADARIMGMESLETEVFSYGYLPLAFSARCFSARIDGRSKDCCEFACMKSPEGIPLTTQEGDSLFTLNGIQTMSGNCHNLLNHWRLMNEVGVSGMRLSAHSNDVFKIIEDLAVQMAGYRCDESLGETHDCNGYWFGQAGIKRV